MSEQYFTGKPTSESRPVDCEFEYRGHALRFTTDAGVFSKGELDNGTRILLKALPDEMQGRVLDLGCGWGPVGVSLGKTFPGLEIVMSDVNERALELSQNNAKRNGVDNAEFFCQRRRLHGKICRASSADHHNVNFSNIFVNVGDRNYLRALGVYLKASRIAAGKNRDKTHIGILSYSALNSASEITVTVYTNSDHKNSLFLSPPKYIATL